MTNPVMNALIGARLQEEPSAFGKWCIVRGVRSLPAVPAHVAGFITDLASGGKSVKQIWPLVQEISQAHVSNGIADPTAGGVVADMINSIAMIDPPRSWPPEEKARFKSLPYDLQCYVLKQATDRERVLRNKMNEIAEAKRQLLKEITPHGTVEEQPAAENPA
jgi:hypothetical protein